MSPSSEKKLGFTLVEMIVSLALFSVVITVAVGALLVLIDTNEQLQEEQSVLTNLSFALDSMTREIRTGTNFFCETANNLAGSHAGGIDNIFNTGNDLDTILAGDPVRDCDNGRQPNGHRYHGLTFVETGNSITGANDRILYFFDSDEGKIFRRIGAEAPRSIVSSGIWIEDAQFYVSGTDKLTGNFGVNQSQPTVTIVIEAIDTETSNATSTVIQTTVVQRMLDI